VQSLLDDWAESTDRKFWGDRMFRKIRRNFIATFLQIAISEKDNRTLFIKTAAH
jgi:hypothetical protein